MVLGRFAEQAHSAYVFIAVCDSARGTSA